MNKMRTGNSHNNVSGKSNKVTTNESDVTGAVRTAVGSAQLSTDMQAVDWLSLDAQRHAIQSEEQFADGAKELVAIRESIRLDSALGRALVSILMVFAQMEREATDERSRESIWHIRRCGYPFRKAPYGFKAVPTADNPRFRALVEDEAEQRILMRIKSMMDEGYDISKLAAILNQDGIVPPQGRKGSKSLLYNLKLRKGWHVCRPVNTRSHSDEEVKARVRELRDRGTSYAAISRILNESGYVPYKGKRFAESGIRRRLDHTPKSKLLTPQTFFESIIRRAEGTRPSYPVLARLLTDGKFATPRGNTHWWPAQVQQLLNGVYDAHYRGVGAPG